MSQVVSASNPAVSPSPSQTAWFLRILRSVFTTDKEIQRHSCSTGDFWSGLGESYFCASRTMPSQLSGAMRLCCVISSIRKSWARSLAGML